MMDKQFKDLEVGEKFIYNDVTFIRVLDERISCCKVLNSENIDTKEKTMILPLENVKVIS
jgi:hypothetical protein